MTSVEEMKRLASANSEKTVRIYNPDTEDFTWNIQGTPHTIRALEMEEFPYDVAKLLKKHLADHLLFKRGIGGASPDDLLAEIYEEIEVEL